MKSFDTLAAMATHFPEAACTPMRAILTEFPEWWDHTDIEQVSFSQVLDSPIFLIEAVEELAHVRPYEDSDGEPLSMLTAPSAAFDFAHWTDGGDFAVMGVVETTNGGPQFYIPAHIAAQAPNVAVSIQMKQVEDAAANGSRGGQQ